MTNESPFKPTFFEILPYLLIILSLCFILSISKFLLILFSELNSHHYKKEQQQNDHPKDDTQKINKAMEQMKQIYYMLLLVIYTIYYFAAFSLPFILLTKFKIVLAIIASVVSICIFAQIIPRVILGNINLKGVIMKFVWIIWFAKLINKIIPLNSPLKKIFNKEINPNINEPFINKQNIYRMLHLSQDAILERPIRQEEVQLLQKLRILSLNSVKGLMIDECNIFLLDRQTIITQKLINHLSRYYFSKILLYSKKKNNIIGFLQFKQLISYEINQKISSKPNLIVNTIIKLEQNDKLSFAFERMIQSKVNFALVYKKQTEQFKGLLKLKDIFSQLLLNWYNYEGLSVDRTFHTFTSQILNKQQKCILEEGQEQI